MIDYASLLERLARELHFLLHQLRLGWPDLRRDPIGFTRRTIAEGGLRLRRVAAPNSIAALATALLVVMSAVLILILLGNGAKENKIVQGDSAELARIIEFLPNPNPSSEDRGVGAGGQGRVGFANDKGEGSAPAPKKSTGGGGSGNLDPLPTQVGKPPPPSEIPAPIPKLPPSRDQALPVAGIDIDPALWKNLPMAVYGDPRSKSSAPSNGPGTGAGMGTANGSGIGEGNGSGFGPGKDGNIGGGPKGIGCCGPGGSQGNNVDDPDRIYPAPLVTERARVLAKPEPSTPKRRGGMRSPAVWFCALSFRGLAKSQTFAHCKRYLLV
jgi:hypothetical protein